MKQEVRDYMAKIGAKGGKAGKGTRLRKRIAKKAALARWKRTRPKNKNINTDDQ